MPTKKATKKNTKKATRKSSKSSGPKVGGTRPIASVGLTNGMRRSSSAPDLL